MSKVTVKYYLNTKLKHRVSQKDGEIRYPIYIRAIHKRIMSSLSSSLGYATEKELENIINSKKAKIELENIKSIFSVLEKTIINFTLRGTKINLGKWIEVLNSPLYTHLEDNLFCTIEERNSLKMDLLTEVKEKFLDDINIGNISEDDLETFVNIDFKNTDTNKILFLYNYAKGIFSISALIKLQFISTLREDFPQYSLLQLFEEDKLLPNFSELFNLTYTQIEDMVIDATKLTQKKLRTLHQMGE